MRLLNDYARSYRIMEPTTIADGEGGRSTKWREGTSFTGYLALDRSLAARRAEKEGVTSLYSVLVDQGVLIRYNDYFKDAATGASYRVTSKPEEQESPRSESFSLKYFTAERKELPE